MAAVNASLNTRKEATPVEAGPEPPAASGNIRQSHGTDGDGGHGGEGGAVGADPPASFDLERPLAAGGAESEYSERVQRLLASIKRDGQSTGDGAACRQGGQAARADVEEKEVTTFRFNLGGAPLPTAHDSALPDVEGRTPRAADVNANSGRGGGSSSAGAQPQEVLRAADAGAASPASGHADGTKIPVTAKPAENGDATQADKAAAAPARAAPPAQPHSDAILAEAAAAAAADAAAAAAATPPAPSQTSPGAAPQRAAPPAHPHPPTLTASPSKPTQSAAAAAAALRHPEEELLKPARWDTHSWLPLVPASGLLCHQGHDVLGFQITPAQRQQLGSWSDGYMETVAQQRVRWMAFLGSHSGVLDTTMRHKIKLLMRLGVPPELRHRVWRLTTGSFAKQRSGKPKEPYITHKSALFSSKEP